jgi:hypothetical protein
MVSFAMSKKISKKYRDLVSDTAKIAKRGQLFEEAARITQDKVLPPLMEVKVNKIRLVNAVFSYFYDKERSKDFHAHDVEPNNQKKLSWMVKWICKIRPFYIVGAEGVDRKQLYYYQNFINPIICITLFRMILKKDPNDFFGDGARDTLIYELHYGNATSNMLAALFDRSYSPIIRSSL